MGASGARTSRYSHRVSTFRNEPIRSFRDPADGPRCRRRCDAFTASARPDATRWSIDGERIDRARDDPLGESGAARTRSSATSSRRRSQERRDALDAATAAFAGWSRTAVAERAGLLFRAAAAMRERKDDFNALMVYEVGKSWIEADADTAEAIDFLEYYAREALRLANPATARALAATRVERAALPAARRRRDHPALELRARDHGRDDLRGDRHRQHRRAQAVAATRRSSRRGSSICCMRWVLPAGVVNFRPRRRRRPSARRW